MALPWFRLDPMETIISNSYRNFHAKGLDYLCLHRSEILTVKAYFYDTSNASPEVVCPHDHRYPFYTTLLAGRSRHYRYGNRPQFLWDAPTHQAFYWNTPLLGGDGFTWAYEANLVSQLGEEYQRGEGYFCRADEVHTIAIHEPDTILLLYQFADTVPAHQATMTFIPGDSKEPPSLAGLYDRMTSERAADMLRIIAAQTNQAPQSAPNYQPPRARAIRGRA